MISPAQRIELSTARPYKYRHDAMPEAIAVSDDGPTVYLIADIDVPVIRAASLTPDEAERIGQALITAARQARKAPDQPGNRIMVGMPHSGDSMTGPGPTGAVNARFVYDRQTDPSTPIGVLWKLGVTDYQWQPGTPIFPAPENALPAQRIQYVTAFRERLGAALAKSR